MVVDLTVEVENAVVARVLVLITLETAVVVTGMVVETGMVVVTGMVNVAVAEPLGCPPPFCLLSLC